MIKPLETILMPSHIMLERNYLSAINSIRLSQAIARAKTPFTGNKSGVNAVLWSLKIADITMNGDLRQSFDNAPTVLLLAAGGSVRFGSDKRSFVLDSKKTLLQQSISQYKDIGLEVFVCLSGRRDDDFLASMLLRESVGCLRCSRAAEGMGGTLSEGVSAIGDVPGILVALADMPGLLSQTVLRILENADSERIVYPVFEGRRGHPVLFGRRYLSLLRELSGDAGASKLLRENVENCVPVPVVDPGVLLDVDTLGDIQGIERLLQGRSSTGEST
jgi:molybdenum cofactor cytidylyltransferase